MKRLAVILLIMAICIQGEAKMNLTPDGFPCQADGDTGDTLNRAGLVAWGLAVTKPKPGYSRNNLSGPPLQVSPGVYIRYTGHPVSDTSGDQLAPVLSYWILMRNHAQASLMPSVRAPNGDLILFRFAPLYARNKHNTLRFIADPYLLVMWLGDFLYMKFGTDPADCNNTAVTLATCAMVKPTLVSRLAFWLFMKFNNSADRLRRYHRAESGGNPEIAEMLISALGSK